MIGELQFVFGRRKVRAALTDELTWRCDERVMEDYLNRTLPAGHNALRHSPLHFLYQAAERLGAEVHPAKDSDTLEPVGV
jgi:hypothetical protein